MAIFGFGSGKIGKDARALRRWSDAIRGVRTTDLTTLRQERSTAKTLRSRLDGFLHAADRRLAAPAPVSPDIPMPHHADWGWRPQIWQSPQPESALAPALNKARFGDDLTVFHDCPLNELSLRQIPDTQSDASAAFGIAFDVLGFDGTFLSLVVDLPRAATTVLLRDHILSLTCAIRLETPIEVFARLNIRNGPNTEQIVREFPKGNTTAKIEFDLAYSAINERRVEKAWVDLIFENPRMNRIALDDLFFIRHRRAQL